MKLADFSKDATMAEEIGERARQEAASQHKWDQRFLAMAEMVASWSKDPSTKCGAVIVRPDKTVASMGFNGFPKYMSDADELYANREVKYARVVHAELNALLHAREPLLGYTMYTWPPGFGPSCERCTVHVIQAGIKRVVYGRKAGDGFASRWKEQCELGLSMYAEAGVQVTAYERE
jgi:dCMP deaminase